nr:hypothetical protein [uncultured Undibacterium sp.]
MKLSSRHRQILIVLAIAVIFALVFLAYLQPGFIVDLANRYVFC